MNTLDKIKIMQHHADGGEVEANSYDQTSYWVCSSAPSWDWNSQSYRIKLKEGSVEWAQEMYEKGEKVSHPSFYSSTTYLSLEGNKNFYNQEYTPSSWGEYSDSSAYKIDWVILKEPLRPIAWHLVEVNKTRSVKWWDGNYYRNSDKVDSGVYARHSDIITHHRMIKEPGK